MAQFRATIQGARGSASRLGHKSTGIDASVSGWHGGVRISAGYWDGDGGDRFDVFATGGSSARTAEKFLGYVDSKGVWHPEEAVRLRQA